MNKLFTGIAAALIIASFALFFLPVRIDGSKITQGTPQEAESASLTGQEGAVRPPSTRAALDPHRVARLFPTVARDAEAPLAEPAQPQPGMITASWLKSLGTVKDGSGVERLYFKDTRNGSIQKFRSDGAEENGYRLLRAVPGGWEIQTPDGTFTLQGER